MCVFNVCEIKNAFCIDNNTRGGRLVSQKRTKRAAGRNLLVDFQATAVFAKPIL